MKLLFYSDLHLDNNETWCKYDLVPHLLNYLREVKPDYVVIAGDIAGSAKEVLMFLARLAEFKILFVPGNHDIWTTAGHKDASWNEYNQLLMHPGNLIRYPLIIGDWAIVGSMGWYDYSFRHKHVNYDECKYLKKKFWNDADMCKWNMTDSELTNLMLQQTNDVLKECTNKNVIFVTHFVPWKDFLTVTAKDSPVTDGYMGSKRLGELLDQYKNVKYVHFGHTHKRFGLMDFGDKKVICNPFGYTGGWKYVHAEDEFEHAGIVVDIG